MKWELKKFTPEVMNVWDEFIKNDRHGSIHQCTAWRDFQSKIPGRKQVLGFYATDLEGNWKAATWCVKMSTGVAQTHWYYSARGPVITEDFFDFKADFLVRISLELKKNKGLFWRLDPYWQEADWVPILKEPLAFSIKPATKNFQPTDSLLLDLTLSKEALTAQMHRQGRKALRIATETQVTTKIIAATEVTTEDLEAWQQLNSDTTRRDGFFGHDLGYYKNFMATLAPFTWFCVAQHNHKTVAAAILTVHHKKAIYYFGASSSDPRTRNLRAPYALQWAMVQHAQTLGAETYDFTGITPVNQPDHPYKGITQFKTRFGGDRVTYAAGKEIVLRPWWYTLYRGIKKIKS